MSYPAMIANPCLDGVELIVPAESWEIRRRVLKTVTELALGGRRESFLYAGAGYPQITSKLEVSIDWVSLREIYGTVEELLSVPGPHTLILWRHEFRAWVGNGSRTEFFLPWQIAADVWEGTLPNGATADRIAPVVKVGLIGNDEGSGLDYLLKSTGDYDGGTPGAGEVWFREGSARFKLATAPALGAKVYARIMPAFSVFESGESEKRLQSPAHEPRKLTLLEE